MIFGKKKLHSVRNDWSELEDLSAEPEVPSDPGVFSVGAAGIMHHMGTTTQCIQLAYYLMYSRNLKRTAYVEMNDSGFLTALEHTYRDVKKDPDGNLCYEQLTMVRKENLATALGGKYEALVYDYGSVGDRGFQRASFREKNVKLLTAGSKPQEILMTMQALSDDLSGGASYLFSFVPKEDETMILKSMEGLAGRVYFAAWTPDMFRANPHMELVYRYLIPKEVQHGQRAEGAARKER